MNSIGLNMILRLGCLCSKESVYINSKKYYIKDQLGEGLVLAGSLIEYFFMMSNMKKFSERSEFYQ